jgi:peroxin-5
VSIFFLINFSSLELIAIITETLWDKEFTSQEQHLSQDIKLESIESQIQQPSDELAQTAAMLLEQVKHEQNPKFKNSQFMDLMRQLRDGRVTVEGSQMVETDEETVSRSNIKGKGRAIDNLGLGQPSVAHLTTSQTTLLNNLSMDSRQEADSREEDANDAYFRQDNEDYMRYWAEKHNISAPNRMSVTEREWDKLQADWDRFEATATGIQEVQLYPFQANNPYLLGDSSRFQMTQQSMIEVCASS